jgi:hypothetical protein
MRREGSPEKTILSCQRARPASSRVGTGHSLKVAEGHRRFDHEKYRSSVCANGRAARIKNEAAAEMQLT